MEHMKVGQLLLIIVITLFFLSSCSNEDTEPHWVSNTVSVNYDGDSLLENRIVNLNGTQIGVIKKENNVFKVDISDSIFNQLSSAASIVVYKNKPFEIEVWDNNFFNEKLKDEINIIGVFNQSGEPLKGEYQKGIMEEVKEVLEN